MAVKTYRFMIEYEECREKLWRVADIQAESSLSELAFLVLSSFDTNASHLFHITYNGVVYAIPEIDEDSENIFETTLDSLNLNVNDKMFMTYDYGFEHRFSIELLSVDLHKNECDEDYPQIIDGTGSGIIDDLSPSELVKAMEKLDSNGDSGVIYKSEKWNYHDFDVFLNNSKLKQEMDKIRESFSL